MPKKPGKGMSKAAVKVVRSALGTLVGGPLALLPGQVRLASREQQRPRPFVPPKAGRRGRR